MTCTLCQRVSLTQSNQYPFLIHEFANSYLMLGEHQFYEGYCVLVAKNHYREITDIPFAESHELYDEMLITSKFISNTFDPEKMNLCSLGNVVDHVHWHFFPRYANDPDFKNPPWLQMDKFDSARLDPEESKELVDKMKLAFQKYQSLSG